MANGRLIAVAGGSGFIGRAIVRRLATMAAFSLFLGRMTDASDGVSFLLESQEG